MTTDQDLELVGNALAEWDQACYSEGECDVMAAHSRIKARLSRYWEALKKIDERGQPGRKHQYVEMGDIARAAITTSEEKA